MIDPNKLCLGCMNELEEENRICKICGWNSDADENSPHQLKCGTVLQGKYLVGKVLGEGGFGITYLGYNLILQKKVAIKEFYPHGFVGRDTTINSTVMSYVGQESFTEKSKEGFIREARTMQSLNKVEGIVEMKDVFAENNTVYIVMEYVEGQTLKEYVKENGNKLPMSTVLKLLEPVMDALEKFHAYNLIHRDISPDNIMVGPDGRVTLLDLGAARQISADGGHSLTVNVKHGYAPVEQYQTHGEQGPWTDIYALCATIYRLITGQVPPSAADRALEDNIVKPSALGANISKEQERVLLKGLAVRSEERFLDIFELKEAFDNGNFNYYRKEAAAAEEKSESKKTRNDNFIKIAITVVSAVLVICIGIFSVSMLLEQDMPMNGNNQTQEDNFDQENIGGQEFGNKQQYNLANALMEDGNYREAVKIFAELGDYKDSKEKFSIIVKKLNEEPANKTIDSGYGHIVGIKFDGTVVAVGSNGNGQCNVFDWEKIVSVSAGTNHTIGLKFDGTVVAKGSNYNGQCNVMEWKDIIAVSAGWDHTVGLKYDGTVVAVGNNDYGQCDVSDWKDIAMIYADHLDTFGIRSDGTVVTTDEDNYRYDLMQDWTDIVALSLSAHIVGLKSDGTVVAVGRNAEDQCNISDWTDIIAISAGNYHTVGLKSDGTVIAIGLNDCGQCDVSEWTDIIAISAEESCTLGLKSDGTVVAVGDNDDGKTDVSDWKNIGINSSAEITDIFSNNIDESNQLKKISLRDEFVLGLKSDGTVVAVGSNSNGQCNVSDWKDIVEIAAGNSHAIGIKSDGTVVAAGNNHYGQCDVSDWTDIIAVAAGKDHTVGLKSDGTLVTAGFNFYDQCDVSDWTDIIAIAAGNDHTVGLKSDGTVVVTGLNDYGQCNISGWTDIVEISAGYYSTVGLKSDGTVVAVGWNAHHECDEVSAWSDIIAISAGSFHIVGLRSNGTVVVVGDNVHDQCDVSSWKDIVSVFAGYYYTIGIESDGTIIET